MSIAGMNFISCYFLTDTNNKYGGIQLSGCSGVQCAALVGDTGLVVV